MVAVVAGTRRGEEEEETLGPQHFLNQKFSCFTIRLHLRLRTPSHAPISKVMTAVLTLDMSHVTVTAAAARTPLSRIICLEKTTDLR